MSDCCSNNSFPTGPQGIQGVQGIQGPEGPTAPSILYNTRTSNTTVNGAGLSSLVSYTIGVNQMKTNDDVIEVNLDFTVAGVGTTGVFNIEMGGMALDTNTLGYLAGSTGGYVKMNFRISRVSATTVFCDFWLQGYDINRRVTTVGYGTVNVAPRTVNNLTSLTNLLDIQASSIGGTITANQFIVKYYNK